MEIMIHHLFKQSVFLSLLLSFGMILCGAAHGCESVVGWPENWQESEEKISSNAGMKGVRQLASKIASNGEKEATIELLSLQLGDLSEPSLDAQFDSVFQAVRAGFELAGFVPRCTPPIRSRLGGLPSMETNCQIIYDDQILLLQSVSMALGQQRLYSLIYTASPSNSAMYRDDYLGTRIKLKLR